MDPARHITRAWLWLLALSALSTILAALVTIGVDARITGTLVLLAAVFKTRLILSRYLGLADAPNWRRGFNLTLSIFALVLLALYLAPLLV